MSGIAKITKGMINPLGGGYVTVINKIIYPLTIGIINKKPQLTLIVKRKELLTISKKEKIK